MARPTPHTALPGMGFKLRSSQVHGSGESIGTATTHHYTMTRQTTGGNGIVRPITHHFVVDEFSKTPGKYNVSYHVTQDGHPYSGGDFDARRFHASNNRRGVKDPIGDLIEHHRMVSNVLDHRMAPPTVRVSPDNVQRFLPAPNLEQAKMVYQNSVRQQWLMDQADRDLKP